MTLVEGHGDYVMDAVGPPWCRRWPRSGAKFQHRREGGNRSTEPSGDCSASTSR